MSSPAALATVTATLQHLLSSRIASAPEVTTQPPSIARNGQNNAQINIFLYGTYYNTAFSNSPMPGEIRNGESALPPLALVLKYLITVYGENNDDISGQHLMGQSMSLLHDYPILGRSDIEGHLPNSGLHQQIERLRISPDNLMLDDMSKLWTSFHSEYRLSTGYEVSVVLIESTRPAKTPLPVLKRGKDDRGVSSRTDLIPPFPAIAEIGLPNKQISAVLGDTLVLNGNHLDGDTVTVRFSHPRLISPIDLNALMGGTETQISVQIPNNPTDWLVGFYTVEAIITKAGEQVRTTNVLPLSLAPRVMGISPPNPVVRNGAGEAILTLTCSPQVNADQRAALLLGDLEVLANDHPLQTDTLIFVVKNAPVGNRYVRLRIDGVDSLLVDRTATPPTFDSAMEVIIS